MGGILGCAGEFIPAATEVGVPTLGVGRPDVLRNHVDQEAVALLALTKLLENRFDLFPRVSLFGESQRLTLQPLRGEDLLGHIFDPMNDADQISAIVEDRRVQGIPIPVLEFAIRLADVVLLQRHPVPASRPENLAKRHFEIPDTRGIGIRRIVREHLEQRLSDDVLEACHRGAETRFVRGQHRETRRIGSEQQIRIGRGIEHGAKRCVRKHRLVLDATPARIGRAGGPLRANGASRHPKSSSLSYARRVRPARMHHEQTSDRFNECRERLPHYVTKAERKGRAQ
jgi:hypothetical protein